MNKYYKIIIVIILFALFSFWIFHNFNKAKKPLKYKITQAESMVIKGRIAIVIDDWGYNLGNLHYLSEIRAPMTISVLPNLPYSRQVAEEAREKGYQVISHLPLESRANERPEKDTFYCIMDEKEITKRLKQILKSVPGILGVNNHQGSKATEDAKMMGIILSELKRENLFFLDSMTTNKSVCAAVARKTGVKYAKRDVFLDLPPSGLKNEELRIYIQRQLDKLCEIAIKRGNAVGIGHDRRATLEVLKSAILQLKKKGIKFVFVSALVN
ncbi:divergent polysaccharide deacetylase family protein [bacterium]|nr:MAG: divergent polysaccharide deacetylase family protein [bacterium]